MTSPLADPDERRQQMAKFLRERAERETLWRQARASAEAAVAHKLARREERQRPFLPLEQERGLEEQLAERLAANAGRRGPPA